MNLWKSNILKLILISILFLGILFLLKPTYWLKITKPFHYEIVSVDTHIANKVLDLKFGVIMHSDYFLDIVLDSIEYEVIMDGTQFSQGKKIFNKNYKFGESDTLQLPLQIELDKIQGIIKDNKNQDSITLVINFKNYVQLPIAKSAIFEVSMNKLIATPNPPKIKVLGIEKKMLKLHEAIYELTFQIQNNNNHEIHIKSFQATLNYPALFTGNVKHQKPIAILPHTSVTSTVKINIDNLNLVGDGLKILLQPKKEWAYILDVHLLLKKEDGSLMPVHISNSGFMPMKKKKKSKK